MSNDTEPQTVEVKYGHAHFKRTLDDGNYGKIEASIMVPFHWSPTDGDMNDVNARIAMAEAKGAVYRELPQIETEVLADGLIIEKLVATFKGSTVESAPARHGGAQDNGGGQRQSAPQQRQGGGGGGLKIKVYKRMDDPRGGVDERGKPNKIENPPWLNEVVQALEAEGKRFDRNNGYIELWDNRNRLPQFGGNGKANSPWFKEKSDSKDNDSCHAVWCPRDSEMNNGAWRHPAFANQGDQYPHDDDF